MGRLIDVNKITDKDICRYLGAYASCKEDVRDLLNNQPTAYDVDKVVKELEVIRDVPKEDEEITETYIWNKAISEAIEIVKAGGIDKLEE